MTEPSMLGWTPGARAWTGVPPAAAWGALSAALFLAFLAIWVVTPAPDSMRRWQPLGLARERLADDGVRGAPGLHANARADSAGLSVH